MALLAAAYLGLTVLALLAAGLLVVVGTAHLWAWSSVWRVAYRRDMVCRRAFPGQTLEARVAVENRKPLPAPWLEVVEDIPGGLLAPLVPASPRFLSLLWYRRASWTYRLVCQRRGCYRLGPAVLRGGDPYGLAAREATRGGEDEVLVYPRLLPLDQIGLPARAIFGRQRPPRSLYEDPSRMAGLRDYRPGDPRNRVHWKATARRGELQVKVHEPTTTPQALLVLAMDGLANPDSPEAEQLAELAISVVATLAHDGAGRGWAVGVFANGAPPVALWPAASPEQVSLILEGLARLRSECPVPLVESLGARRDAMAAGTTVVFVAAGVDAALVGFAADLCRAGHAIAFVPVGAEPTADVALAGWSVFPVRARGA